MTQWTSIITRKLSSTPPILTGREGNLKTADELDKTGLYSMPQTDKNTSVKVNL